MNSEFRKEYFDSLVKRFLSSFPDSGLITMANMMGSYDEWRESQQFYYNLFLEATKNEE